MGSKGCSLEWQESWLLARGLVHVGFCNSDIWYISDQSESWRQWLVNPGGIHRALVTLPSCPCRNEAAAENRKEDL
jgi:hypothetical protein